MKYTREQRLDIGRRIYEGELTCRDAATEYGISPYTARDYMRLYRDEYQLPARNSVGKADPARVATESATRLDDYEAMSKEELIRELVRAKIAEARLKKGYEVKGAGGRKEFIRLGNKNTK